MTLLKSYLSFEELFMNAIAVFLLTMTPPSSSSLPLSSLTNPRYLNNPQLVLGRLIVLFPPLPVVQAMGFQSPTIMAHTFFSPTQTQPA